MHWLLLHCCVLWAPVEKGDAHAIARQQTFPEQLDNMTHPACIVQSRTQFLIFEKFIKNTEHQKVALKFRAFYLQCMFTHLRNEVTARSSTVE